MQYDDVTANPI